MGVINQGILGGFRKKVGPVVGSSWKGIAVMKSKPLSVANPNTAAQQTARGAFKRCSLFASSILSQIIKPLMDRFAGQMSGYNFFIKQNIEAFGNEAPSLQDIIISKGRLLAPTSVATTIQTGTMSVTVGNPQADKYALASDKVYLLIVDNAISRNILFAGEATGTRGSSATSTVTIPGFSSPGAMGARVYASFLRADGSEVSDTFSDSIS